MMNVYYSLANVDERFIPLYSVLSLFGDEGKVKFRSIHSAWQLWHYAYQLIGPITKMLMHNTIEYNNSKATSSSLVVLLCV